MELAVADWGQGLWRKVKVVEVLVHLEVLFFGSVLFEILSGVVEPGCSGFHMVIYDVCYGGFRVWSSFLDFSSYNTEI